MEAKLASAPIAGRTARSCVHPCFQTKTPLRYVDVQCEMLSPVHFSEGANGSNPISRVFSSKKENFIQRASSCTPSATTASTPDFTSEMSTALASMPTPHADDLPFCGCLGSWRTKEPCHLFFQLTQDNALAWVGECFYCAVFHNAGECATAASWRACISVTRKEKQFSFSDFVLRTLEGSVGTGDVALLPSMKWLE